VARPASVAALPRLRMWRGSGWLPRHAARRGQRGHRVQKSLPRVIFKNKLKKVKIKKLSHPPNSFHFLNNIIEGIQPQSTISDEKPQIFHRRFPHLPLPI
jgi:hypothetical protein